MTLTELLESLEQMPPEQRRDWIERFNKLTVEPAAPPVVRRMRGNQKASCRYEHHCSEHVENSGCSKAGCAPVDMMKANTIHYWHASEHKRCSSCEYYKCQPVSPAPAASSTVAERPAEARRMWIVRETQSVLCNGTLALHGGSIGLDEVRELKPIDDARLAQLMETFWRYELMENGVRAVLRELGYPQAESGK